MNLNDVRTVHRIETDLFSDPWPKKSFEHEIKKGNYSFPFILEENKQIIGYIICWYYFSELHIGNIAVIKEMQRRGIGTFLLEKVLEYFKDYKKAFLEVRESNTAAIQLYKNFNFVETYRRIRYYSNGEDAIVMIKTND
jgi:ribosomal-protein-alanine N-acetyltransferase